MNRAQIRDRSRLRLPIQATSSLTHSPLFTLSANCSALTVLLRLRLLCWLCADKRIVLSTGMIYAPAHSNWANRQTDRLASHTARQRDRQTDKETDMKLATGSRGFRAAAPVGRMCFSRTSACVSYGTTLIVLSSQQFPTPTLSLPLPLPSASTVSYMEWIFLLLLIFLWFQCVFFVRFSEWVCRVEKLV